MLGERPLAQYWVYLSTTFIVDVLVLVSSGEDGGVNIVTELGHRPASVSGKKEAASSFPEELGKPWTKRDQMFSR